MDMKFYKFKDRELLQEALTHPCTGKKSNYQRLELMGDRVLNMVVMEMLFREYPDENEGLLSQRMAYLVSGSVCEEVARSLNIQMLVDCAQNIHIASQANTLADVCEALIGAMYFDGGLEPVRTFIRNHWDKFIAEAGQKDAKTRLQEYLQGQKLPGAMYILLQKTGPDHKPTFAVKCSVGLTERVGTGSSKKEAEHNAAEAMLVDCYS